jgi:hypothetical protein
MTFTAGAIPDNPLVFSVSNHIRNPLTPGTYEDTFSGSIEPNPALSVPVDIIAFMVVDTDSDAMATMTAGDYSTHTITYNFANSPVQSDTFSLSLPTSAGFNCTGLTSSDISVSADWLITSVTDSSCTVLFTAISGPTDPIVITIADNGHVRNPLTPGTYYISFIAPDESKSLAIPIVDSDQVNVTSYVNTFMTFDIDTAVADTHCNFNTCLNYENGTAANNYTVDLGELNAAWVNQSHTDSVSHADGGQGVINSVYLNLSTNAINGAIVNVTSAHGSLLGPGGNTIASVANGQDIAANSGKYGFSLTGVEFVNGTINLNNNCIYGGEYCALTQSPLRVFDSNDQPLEGGRIRMDIAAAATYTNNPGSYSDTLTFIATATY